MNSSQISTIERSLLNCFSESQLRIEAEKLGFILRHKDIEFMSFGKLMLNVNTLREMAALGEQDWDCARWAVLNVYRKRESISDRVPFPAQKL